MAVETFSQMQIALALAGNELVCISVPTGEPVPFVTRTTTTQQIAAIFNGVGVVTPSMRQLKAALNAQGLLLSVNNTVPADLTNADYIAWFSAFRMAITDPFVTGFLMQPPLNFTQDEINVLFALALEFPV